MFQFTHPHGVRPEKPEKLAITPEVLIHAPAWGATILTAICEPWQWTFQFTHPHGVRPPTPARLPRPFGFQFTHPHGVRPFRQDAHGSSRSCFNSRTRMGCDPKGPYYVGDLWLVSIHAPAWGATYVVGSPKREYCEFQFTHPHGVRLFGFLRESDDAGVSIHAPAWGATRILPV